MGDLATDETLLLDLLNTTPVVGGVRQDLLTADAAKTWLHEHGGSGSAAERRATRSARDLLQAVARGDAPPESLAVLLDGIRSAPSIQGGQIVWMMDVPLPRRLAVRAVLAWDAVGRDSPGRLRPCANSDCALFLIDHSKSNRARWCSMAVCGNRMKARRHYERTRSD